MGVVSGVEGGRWTAQMPQVDAWLMYVMKERQEVYGNVVCCWKLRY
jgi:hypothetical protein